MSNPRKIARGTCSGQRLCPRVGAHRRDPRSEQAGIRPDLVCGTSIGALVGAVYAAGELDRFEQWVLELGIPEVLGFMDVSLTAGCSRGSG